ncbi:hypothetical protein K6T82_05550 [Flavobacterium sp. 17A]|uniref:Glycoside hydrolase family 5 domain-containing protein n=1 Tax=Flavobacterium potami TaxID=2872310 RepID=A0A9X1KQJ3_9FLAO|nr:hypothetical protein [Flavobacterium potami]MBZ4034221.1 hypothetical protein [Flavobacterium potami]
MKIQNSIALMCVLLGFSAQSQNSVPIVSINPNEVISNEFIGSGIEFSAYPHADTEDSEWGKLMTDEKWQLVFDRVSYIKPKIARVMDQANWRYLKGFDANGKPIIDFESDQMKALYKLLDYCEKNKIAVILGEWGQPYKVHDIHLNLQNSFTGANDPKWIDLIVKNLNHLLKVKKYSCIKYYNLVNEPNGDWATTDGDFEQWKEGIELLHKAIKKEGLDKYISIIGPDATSFNNPRSKYKGLDWARQTALQIPDLVAAYDVHDYPSKESIRSGEFQKTFSELVRFTDSVQKKPFILGELGLKGEPSSKKHLGDKFTSVDSQLSVYDYDYGVDMADALIQSINSGFDAVVAWDLDDAMHTKDDRGDKYQLKRWGMFNSLGKELTDDKTDENLRPWFYTWSIMTRYLTSDMKIVKIENLNLDKVRTVTGITKNGDITIAIANNSDTEANFTIDTKKLKLKSELHKYLYSENKRPVDAKGFPVPLEKISLKNNAIQVSIPAKSVILYTSYQP